MCILNGDGGGIVDCFRSGGKLSLLVEMSMDSNIWKPACIVTDARI